MPLTADTTTPGLVPFWLQLVIAAGIVAGSGYFYFSSTRAGEHDSARALATHMLRFARTFALINLVAHVIHAVTRAAPEAGTTAKAQLLGSVIRVALDAGIAGLIALAGTGVFVWLSRRLPSS